MKDGLKLLEEMAKNMRSMKDVTVAFPLSGENTEKVQSLKTQGRDFFAVNKTAEQAFARGMQQVLDADPDALGESGGMSKVLKGGVEEFKELVVDRFEKGGGDVSMRPLKSSTVASKGSSKVGTDTGALSRSVKACKPIVR
jgi:hypothetical protein